MDYRRFRNLNESFATKEASKGMSFAEALDELDFEEVEDIEECAEKPIEEKIQLPYNSKLRSMTNTAAISTMLLKTICTGDLKHLSVGGIALIVNNLIVSVLEAYRFNKLVKKHDTLKQLLAKSPAARRSVYVLIDKVGVRDTAEALERLEDEVKSRPELMDHPEKFQINIIEESTDRQGLDISMEDFLKALADMRSEYGDDYVVDAAELNTYVRDWKADGTESGKTSTAKTIKESMYDIALTDEDKVGESEHFILYDVQGDGYTLLDKESGRIYLLYEAVSISSKHHHGLKSDIVVAFEAGEGDDGIVGVAGWWFGATFVTDPNETLDNAEAMINRNTSKVAGFDGVQESRKVLRKKKLKEAVTNEITNYIISTNAEETKDGMPLDRLWLLGWDGDEDWYTDIDSQDIITADGDIKTNNSGMIEVSSTETVYAESTPDNLISICELAKKDGYDCCVCKLEKDTDGNIIVYRI